MELDYIYNGDCLEYMRTLPDKSIDLVITDPPYEIESIGGGSSRIARAITKNNESIKHISNGFDYENVLNELCRVMKNINIYIWCNKTQIPIYFNYFLPLGCNFDIFGWNKTNAMPSCNGKYLSDVEWCLFFKKGGEKLGGDYQTKKHIFFSNINIKDKKKYNHPTIKPLDFIKNFIINSSKKGDLILDPFMGSGTTAVACKCLDRHYIGAEINSEYFNVINERLGKEVVDFQNKILENNLF